MARHWTKLKIQIRSPLVSEELLRLTDRGLYCPAGDFFIDPWRTVPKAVVTHGHSDHARPGSDSYLAAVDGLAVLKTRLGDSANITPIDYGKTVDLNGVQVSLHPAGHILGSAQVRIEHLGQVVVVSGDYKVQSDPTCKPFEPVRCHLFVTESTFGLPIYRWPQPEQIANEVNAWWRNSAVNGKCCVLFAYALGKSQRLLAGLDPSIGPIYEHGAVSKLTQAYRDTGVALPSTEYAGQESDKKKLHGAMVLAPPSAAGTPWLKRFQPYSTAFASGWMRIRGARRRRSMDRGFVLSDHVDWPGLMQAIAATGAERVWVTHGYSDIVVRHLREKGIDAAVVSTHFEDETIAASPE